MADSDLDAQIAKWRREEKRWKKNYRHWLRTRRRGDRVACLYDGKSGRAVWGTVLRRKKDVVCVRLDGLWAERQAHPVDAVFVNGGGWVAGGLMPLLGFIRGANRTGGSWYGLRPVAGERGSVAMGEHVLDRQLMTEATP